MQFYAFLNGDTLEFRKEKPESGEYVECISEKKYFVPPWNDLGYYAKSIRFLDKISPVDMTIWFNGMTHLEYFDAANLDLSHVTSLTGAFSNCSSLKTLNLSGWNVSGVSNMEMLFYGCTELREVNLSGWKAPKVQNLSLAFAHCPNLTELDLSMLSPDRLCNLSGAFEECSKLKTLKLPKLPSDMQISEIEEVFEGCHALRNVHIYDTNVFQGGGILNSLEQCKSLTNIRIIREETV